MTEAKYDDGLYDSRFTGRLEDDDDYHEDTFFRTGEAFVLEPDFDNQTPIAEKVLTDEEKMAKVLLMFKGLPLDERQKMFRRLKKELKKLDFDEDKYNDLPF